MSFPLFFFFEKISRRVQVQWLEIKISENTRFYKFFLQYTLLHSFIWLSFWIFKEQNTCILHCKRYSLNPTISSGKVFVFSLRSRQSLNRFHFKQASYRIKDGFKLFHFYISCIYNVCVCVYILIFKVNLKWNL